MISSTQGSLTMLDLNTPTPKIFWNGVLVENVTGITVQNDADTQRVVLKMYEAPVVAELQAAGILIKRGV
jgi:hypothetical protein